MSIIFFYKKESHKKNQQQQQQKESTQATRSSIRSRKDHVEADQIFCKEKCQKDYLLLIFLKWISFYVRNITHAYFRVDNGAGWTWSGEGLRLSVFKVVLGELK